MSAKPRLQLQTHSQIVNQVPPEIWEQIFKHLYPSQLSRMSMVNKCLSVIVSSLEVWPRMFCAVYGPKAQLRPLICIPKGKSSHMIFMCASSLHVCEKCFSLTGYSADKLYMLPLPIPILLPRRSTDEAKYMGGRFDPSWTIRMCLSCRQEHLSNLEEPVPHNVTNRQIDPWDMSDISGVYEELLASNAGDILVKLKDGKQLKVISYLIKNRSSVFKTMLESSMQEAATGAVDLSSQYGLEAFREFMAYIYYNKTYAGSYLPLLFEILSITDYYDVDAYRTYINDRIIDLITNVPICLTIASEALKHGTLTEKIYSRCLSLLVEALKPKECIGFGA
ncbi:hypothetical protein BGX24_002982, partial [Mortierella sp. AD032]